MFLRSAFCLVIRICRGECLYQRRFHIVQTFSLNGNYTDIRFFSVLDIRVNVALAFAVEMIVNALTDVYRLPDINILPTVKTSEPHRLIEYHYYIAAREIAVFIPGALLFIDYPALLEPRPMRKSAPAHSAP